MRKKAIIISLIVVILIGWFFVKPKFFGQMHAGQMPPQGALEVSVIVVQKQKTQRFIELPARVSSYKISEVRPQIDGVVKKINFAEGSVVKAGQQLYQIDPNVYQAAFNGANSNLKALKAKRDRYKSLLEEDAVSKQEFDDVEAAFAQANAEAEAAKKKLDYTKVYAPISGYIGKSNVTEGALVTANQMAALTTITELNPIYVDMVQPSKEAVKMGDQKEIEVSLKTDDAAYKNVGKLKFTEVFVDVSTDSVRLRAIFSNKDKKLLPGMFVKAKLHLKEMEAITVPQRVASRGPDGNLMVWTVDKENSAKPRVIKASQALGDSWIVEEGLEDGVVIICEGFQKLVDGAKVKPILMVTK